MVDHRASPGISEAKALSMGLNPKHVAEGKLYETATLGCNHCGRNFIRNPMRIRQRGWCSVCDKYICDTCDAARRHPDYVHYTYRQLAELVMGGKYEIRGSFSRPLIVPRQGA